jgi:bla regulator protein BlaR1
MMLLLQRLLTDRFRLTLHRETRQLPAYQLTVDKNGPKLEPTDTGADLPFKKANKDKGTRIAAEHLTMPQFAEILSRRLRHPVQDATGLVGAYRVSLDWVDDEKDKSGKPRKESPSRDLPSIFTALREQMGLRLESRKTQVAAFVIDHIERTPIPN